MRRYKYILWDWNGTLIDDLQMNLDIEKFLLSERGLPLLGTDKEFYLENFGFPIIDFYKLCGFDFQKESYQSVAIEYAEEYKKRIGSVKLFDDVIETLDTLGAHGFRQVIISATEHELLVKQVKSFGIADKFEKILGAENNLGFSKVQSALNWFRENNIDASEAVFIGDTTHDYETAQAIGCDCFLVATGHNSKRRLTATGCEVFTSLSKVLNRLVNA